MWRWCLCALLCARAIARHDDDFAFDNSEEYRAEILSNKSATTNGLRRLWGIPDTTAYTGRLFRMEIPKEAFSGDVLAYKVRGADGRRTPSWLAVDARHGLLSGVPLDRDVGTHSLAVTAHGHTNTAVDTFTIEVKRSSGHWRRGACSPRESRLELVLVLGARLHQMPPKQRTRALMRLANFMALDGEELYIDTYKPGALLSNQSVLQSGPGSTRNRRDAAASAIHIHVGCGGKLWPRHKVLVAGAREQARDGTLSHTLELPVLGWRLLAEKPAPMRPRRQADNLAADTYDDGSGDYEDYDDEEDGYSGDGDDMGEYDDGKIDEPRIKPDIIPDSTNYLPTLISSLNDTEDIFKFRNEKRPSGPIFSLPTPSEKELSSTPSIVIVPVPETTTTERTPIIIEAMTEPIDTPTAPQATPTAPQATPTSRDTTAASSTTPTKPNNTPTTVATVPTTLPTTPTISSTTTSTTTEAPVITTQKSTPATEPSSPIDGTVTEVVDFGLPPTTPVPTPPPPPPVNQPPKLQYHIKKLAITAGKAFRYLIPQDLFTDAEDNLTLTYSMFDHDNTPLKPSSWVQFMPDRREVYGLPLDEHVSRWSFTVQATDSGGAAARAPLDIIVQQYKGQRTLNHQFTLKLKLQHKYRYAVDWQIDVLEGLVNLFRSTDMDNIVVRGVGSDGDLATFSWSDDTFAKDVCPTQDIERLMSILESPTDRGSPSANLSRAMQPNLKVASVTWSGVGACAPPTPPPQRADTSFPPVPRNQVDLVRATAGHLLVFKVPEDTFYDPEDGGTRNLKLSVIRGDRSALPSTHWLQFDTNNQEFYGLPTDRDRGKKEYQLIAEDSTGKTANDVLLVEVNAAPNIHPPVEFTIAMKYPYAALAVSALAKRAFIESLATLFGDKDASSIRVKSISDNPTTVVWYNTSLPQDRCPDDQMRALKDIIVRKEDDGKETLTDRVHQLLDKHDVMSIQMVPRGACAREASISKVPPPVVVPGVSSADSSGPASERALREYVVTVIVPAAVVACMIVLAAAVAYVLYRRRLTAGKMSVGDEEERQAFRSRGIPVIFQDELDDKPDPGNKSPVIMKEEKPPLLPPPDYRPDADSPTPSHHTPYRPPPPFTASRERNAPRPKATPTYRKPPPYVPP